MSKQEASLKDSKNQTKLKIQTQREEFEQIQKASF